MTDLYPEIEPFEQGFLEVDSGNLIYWETCGNPHGKAAVHLVLCQTSLHLPSSCILEGKWEQRRRGVSLPHGHRVRAQ